MNIYRAGGSVNIHQYSLSLRRIIVLVQFQSWRREKTTVNTFYFRSNIFTSALRGSCARAYVINHLTFLEASKSAIDNRWIYKEAISITKTLQPKRAAWSLLTKRSLIHSLVHIDVESESTSLEIPWWQNGLWINSVRQEKVFFVLTNGHAVGWHCEDFFGWISWLSCCTCGWSGWNGRWWRVFTAVNEWS